VSLATTPDPVAVIEASYRPATAEQDWVRTLAETARPMVERGQGVMAFTFDLRDRTQLRSENFVDLGLAPGMLDVSMRCMSALRGPIVEQVIQLSFAGTRSAFTMTEVIGVDRSQQIAAMFGFPANLDVTVIRALAPEGFGCIIAAHHDIGEFVLAKRDLDRWTRLTAHMVGGRRILWGTTRGAQGDGDAIVAPGGTVEHAVGLAKEPDRLAALTAAASDIERARGRLRREDPETAVSLWRGLVDGRWSLIERLERDGKRFYVAHRNDPRLSAPLALTERERQVVAFAAMALSNKEIAYNLGLRTATVGSYLAVAMEKLGLRSRTELVQIAAQLGAAGDGDQAGGEHPAD
jgi:DNA-binding CsgD family transcriptional regulator